MGKRGAQPYQRYDDEICELLNIQNVIGLSDSELIRRYKANDSPNTVRHKLRLLSGCTPTQFSEIKRVILEAKKEWEERVKSILN